MGEDRKQEMVKIASVHTNQQHNIGTVRLYGCQSVSRYEVCMCLCV